MGSRESILEKLRSRQKPFPEAHLPDDYLPMTPITGDIDDLVERFIQEAVSLNTHIYRPADEQWACEVISGLIGEDKTVLAWEWEEIPLLGLKERLEAAHITDAEPGDPYVRVGISGAHAALASTGSLVLCSGQGRHRATSLLPPVHIVVITVGQILPNFEAWVRQERDQGLPAFRSSSNTVIVSGCSRTADIAQELILGMHGPQELHIIILKS